jgi:hypothetical protein
MSELEKRSYNNAQAHHSCGSVVRNGFLSGMGSARNVTRTTARNTLV